MDSVYEPAEDSWLMENAVRLFAKGYVLDMGTGSGILAAAAAERATKVVGADINPEAVTEAKETYPHIIFKQSDLFSAFPGEKFDTIIFNPPYLPTNEEDPEDIALNGGKDGDEVLLHFLKEAPEHLELAGCILFLTSSLTRMDRIEELLKGFKHEVVGQQKVAFELLSVHKVWR
ncbi:MAG: HemK2/MTQ2 family protein methyltransferase [Nanoarchaeota archaeon]